MHPLLKLDTRKIITVSELTGDIKSLLEDNFPALWISGEISNLKMAASGHAYFTLKDDKAQISSVMFRGAVSKLKFNLEDGLELIVHGRVSVYEPRGQYQIILDSAEPKGLGALQLAFEQLKNKLSAEGLFDEAHKKPLPILPKKIGLITSAQGAVVHDMVNVITRRYPGMALLIYPVRVQGDGAAAEIALAIREMNERSDLDLLIVGRGGGSLEDLWAFNEEIVVRAVYSSALPIISAVGHETDYTLCDLAADLRAPTPSAAAELAVPKKEDLQISINEHCSAIFFAIRQLIKSDAEKINFYKRQIKNPQKMMDDLRLKLSDLQERQMTSMKNFLLHRRSRLKGDKQQLLALSPLSLLKRGYGLVMKEGRTMRSVAQMRAGDVIEIVMADGKRAAVVT